MARRVLITMGGSDPLNATSIILAALAGSRIEGLEVVVVAGPANPYRERLSEIAATMPFRSEVRQAPIDMASLMRWADAAITAAGTTTYELAALGVPFLAVVIADNQQRNVVGLATQGVTQILDDFGKEQPEHLAAQIDSFLLNAEVRKAQAVAGRHLVDGLGASRVVTAMLAKDVRLRPVSPEDEALLLRWANDPETRANSFCTETITPTGHTHWLAAKLADADCAIYLAVDPANVPLGVARFELFHGRAMISVGIAPEFRQQGLGSRVIRAACERIFAERDLGGIEALVKVKNVGSLKAFRKAGFQVGGTTERNGIPALFLHCDREACHG